MEQMMYFGGKQRISKELAQFLNSQLKEKQTFIDLFCGSCNVVSKIDSGRIRVANDIHYELIDMWLHVQRGGKLPDDISEKQYYDIKGNAPPWLQGFVGFGCSYSGKWWGGYARGGEGRNYCRNAKNSTLKKMESMKDVVFTQRDYKKLAIPCNSLIYCDIPYKDTTGYSLGDFEHRDFYIWAKDRVREGHSVYVSEYLHNVPDDWTVVWQKNSKKDIRNKDGEQVKTVEVVMTPEIWDAR